MSRLHRAEDLPSKWAVTPTRVLVVDDSRASRQRISALVDGLGTTRVVGTATNGADALRLSRDLKPDVVTLDLEMPELGGFSFLRVLMATRPLPVVVVSTNRDRASVIQALELGALDFIAKSDLEIPGFESVLARKLRAAASAHVSTTPRRPLHQTTGELRIPLAVRPPRFVVAIAASTGGPTALLETFPRLDQTQQFAILIAQHMPAHFTTALAERLDQQTPFSVAEAKDGTILTAGHAFLCPGGHCMELERLQSGQLRLRVRPPHHDEHYVPNASQLLASTADAVGDRAIGVVLTGMGDDGARGAEQIAKRGGRVLVECASTAVMASMPKAALRRVPHATPVPLSLLAERLASMIPSL